MGTRHLYGLGELTRTPFANVELVAVCDIRRDNAELAADEAQKLLGSRPKVFTDLEQMSRTVADLQAVEDANTAAGLTGFDAELSWYSGIQAYTGSFSTQIREYLASGRASVTTSSNVAKMAKAYVEGTKAAPVFKGALHRGMYMADAEAFAQAIVENGGTVFNQSQGFSRRLDVAKNFGKDVMFHIKTNRSRSGRSVETVSGIKSDQEVMFLPGVRFKLVRRWRRYKVAKRPSPDKARFWDIQGIALDNQCAQCEHLDPQLPTRCAAFPTRIPDDIIDYSFDHTNRHPGQVSDLLFKQRPLNTAERLMKETP
jgi:hypothetical protein